MKKYAAESGPHQSKAATIYQELRNNLIQNTFAVSDISLMVPVSCNSLTLLALI
jgi:hypothetical protein